MVRPSHAPLDACRWLRFWEQSFHVRPWTQQARFRNHRKVRLEACPIEEPTYCTYYRKLIVVQFVDTQRRY